MMKSEFQVTLEALSAYAIPILTLRKKSQSPYLLRRHKEVSESDRSNVAEPTTVAILPRRRPSA